MKPVPSLKMQGIAARKKRYKIELQIKTKKQNFNMENKCLCDASRTKK
jgi:hypothetical protein